MTVGHGHWMPLYWADYFAATTHFTTEMHGAYFLLLGAYWRRGNALPDDDAFLASAAKMTKRRFKTVRDTITEKFVKVDGLLYHVRVEIELLKSCSRISSAQAKANARWHAGDMQSTITTTKEESKKVIQGNFGGKKGGIEMTPENRLSLFHNWLAPLLGPDGWSIIAEAMNPESEFYAVAVETCKITAKKNGKGWPHQWPK